jgi:hypothetical protein
MGLYQRIWWNVYHFFLPFVIKSPILALGALKRRRKSSSSKIYQFFVPVLI